MKERGHTVFSYVVDKVLYWVETLAPNPRVPGSGRGQAARQGPMTFIDWTIII